MDSKFSGMSGRYCIRNTQQYLLTMTTHNKMAFIKYLLICDNLPHLRLYNLVNIRKRMVSLRYTDLNDY